MNKKQLLNEILSTLKEKENTPFVRKIDEVYELNAKIMGAFGGFLTVFKDLVNPLTKKVDTLIAMQRELINEVKKLHTSDTAAPRILPVEEQPIPLVPRMSNDVKTKRVATRERDLFSHAKQHYDYTDTEKTIGQAKAVKTLLAEGYNLSDRPFLALHSLVRHLGIPVLPTKAKNAKSGNYRIYVKDLQKIRDYLR